MIKIIFRIQNNKISTKTHIKSNEIKLTKYLNLESSEDINRKRGQTKYIKYKQKGERNGFLF